MGSPYNTLSYFTKCIIRIVSRTVDHPRVLYPLTSVSKSQNFSLVWNGINVDELKKVEGKHSEDTGVCLNIY